MKYQKTNQGFVIRIMSGENLMETLDGFCREQGIGGGFFYGLGASSRAELLMYDPSTKEYEETALENQLEITNLTGNVALKDGEIKLHAHITLADENQNAFGGHLKEATIKPTCEIFLTALDVDLARTRDEESGLDLLDL